MLDSLPEKKKDSHVAKVKNWFLKIQGLDLSLTELVNFPTFVFGCRIIVMNLSLKIVHQNKKKQADKQPGDSNRPIKNLNSLS